MALIALAHGVVEWWGDPSDHSLKLIMLGLGTASLATLGWSAWGLMMSDASPRRRVFCGRRLLLFFAELLAASAGFVASLVIRDPFRHIASTGEITAHELLDVDCILGAVISLTATVIVGAEAWKSLDDERHWGRSLGIGS